MTDFTKNDSLLVKGIAVLIMIYYHSVALSSRAAVPFFGNVLAKTGNICVALFAFITVYGTTKSLNAKEKNGRFDMKEAMAHSLGSLYRSYLPAFFYALLLSVLFDRLHDVIWSANTDSLITAYGSGGIGIFHAVINGSGLTHLIYGDFLYTLNQTWWYMSLAILLALMTILVFTAWKKKTMWLIILPVYALLALKRPMYFQYLMMVPIGMAIADRRLFFKTSPASSVLVLAMILAWGYMRIYVSGPWNTIVDVLAAYPIIVLILTVFKRIGCRKPFEYLGRHSANLFYLHSFVYLYWRPLAYVVDQLKVGFLIFPVTVIVTLLVAIPLERITKKIGK